MNKGALIGRGRTAEIYAWGDRHALKLFYAGWPAANAQAEAAVARRVRASGARAPAVDGVIEVDGRPGIVYERVDGPSLLRRASAQPWTLLRSARLLAELHAELHARPASGLPSQRQYLIEQIHAAPALSIEQKKAALDTLAQLPDGEALCHGDFHPDNILLTARGPIIIDWPLAMRGNPLADVARTSLLLRLGALPPGTPGRWLIETGRALFHHLYLRRYIQHRVVSRGDIATWQLPIAAARLSEGVSGEEKPLLALISAMLSG